MKGVFERYDLKVGEVKEKGLARLSCFEFKRENDPLSYMRMAMDGMAVRDGKYMRLSVAGQLMMTDTDMEKRSNQEFCQRSNGRVLVAGLGIGLIIHNIWGKLISGEVSELIIVEKYQDTIDLISPYFQHPNIKYICHDIFDYKPLKEERFDTIYFDIWPEICIDNLGEIRSLHNSFKNKINRGNPKSWMNSWMKEALQRLNRKQSSYFYY